MKDIRVPVSPGELIDKLTILRLKAENISDPVKRENVLNEQAQLDRVALSALPEDARLRELGDALYEVNADLWAVEDDIRACEARGDFGPAFVALARAVYTRNDERAAIKRAINDHLGSDLVEEKSYTDPKGAA